MAFKLYEMASLPINETGLPLKIYVSIKGNSRHSCRIKVSSLYGNKFKSDSNFVITVEDIPKIIGNTGGVSYEDIYKVTQFVIDNKDILWKYWREEIGTIELVSNLKLRNR